MSKKTKTKKAPRASAKALREQLDGAIKENERLRPKADLVDEVIAFLADELADVMEDIAQSAVSEHIW